jgi:23S rRNA (cytidine1920-2'-O)/16S rRNA (cytidine1409-2'-O)-methyltransferase
VAIHTPFVSRAGLKLEHALREFQFDVTGFTCADFGCNIGGFTDCLLQRGAAKVYAIDTGYGVLAWKLRNDPRVVVMERTNALHVPFPADAAGGVEAAGGRGVDLVVIDLAWTPQRLAIPAALRWLKPRPDSRVISLVKPHYELDEDEKRRLLRDGFLDPAEAEPVFERAAARMPALGARVLRQTVSPLTGRKSSRKSAARGDQPEGAARGNVEYLVLLEPASQPAPGAS